MIVNQIRWLSKEAEEALLIIGDGNHECAAFSHPCYFDQGYVLLEPLLACEAIGIRLSKESKVSIVRQQKWFFAHDIVGILSSFYPVIINVGGIKIEVHNDFPMGININDFVQFSCDRLDVIR